MTSRATSEARAAREDLAVVDTDDRKLTAFKAIRLRKAADEVVAVLVDAIRGGLYRTGDLLPRERDLARQLGVSRTVVREAIGVLRQAGVVSVRRGVAGGAVVVSLANLGRLLADLHAGSQEAMRSILEVRRPLEFTAALLVGERATDEDLERLTLLVDALDEAIPDPDTFFALDVQFHLTVAELSGNALVAELLTMTLNRLLAVRAQFPVGHVDHEAAAANQRQLLNAICSRNRGKIRRAIDEHMAAFEELFLGGRLTSW